MRIVFMCFSHIGLQVTLNELYPCLTFVEFVGNYLVTYLFVNVSIRYFTVLQ